MAFPRKYFARYMSTTRKELIKKGINPKRAYRIIGYQKQINMLQRKIKTLIARNKQYKKRKK